MGNTVGDRRINGVFGNIAFNAEIIVIATLLRQCAACQVCNMTSPTRLIAWESEDSIEKAPKSCRIS